MGEASPVLPIPVIHEATLTFVAGFLSFKKRLSRRSAEKETSRTSAETNGYGTCASARGLGPTSGLFHYPVPIPEKGQVMESMLPPLDRKEIVLGLPAPSAAPLLKGRKRNGAATETAKKRRCSNGAEGELSGPLPQYRASRLRSEVERLTEGLAESREALKRIEATLKSTEDAHAAETSQLEVQVSGLEWGLRKSASALFRMKKREKRQGFRSPSSSAPKRAGSPLGHS
ncbi:hypothetical protein F2Q70_00026222 [Brassica cretica]|uniref:Uncharacterized protein n=1 Tax=Brassica cretica TaxID=69181 RepID=A0A8S9L7F3_BRACR|nr:hypothetical protein F2Q70_00026222 [Brassica cretica]